MVVVTEASDSAFQDAYNCYTIRGHFPHTCHRLPEWADVGEIMLRVDLISSSSVNLLKRAHNSGMLMLMSIMPASRVS